MLLHRPRCLAAHVAQPPMVQHTQGPGTSRYGQLSNRVTVDTSARCPRIKVPDRRTGSQVFPFEVCDPSHRNASRVWLRRAETPSGLKHAFGQKPASV
jgi:hypothetical protein